MSDFRPKIVTQSRVATPRALVIMGLAVLAAIGVGALGAGLLARPNAQSGEGFDGAAALAAAKAKAGRLQQRISILERGSQVTEMANRELRAQLVEMEGDLARLTDEVGFYQRLIGAGGGNRGLGVHALQLESTPSGRVYRFVLTLSQNLKKANQVTGSLELVVEGVQADRAVVLDWSNLGVHLDGESREFAFKYFQQVRGSFELPADFYPQRVIVSLKPDGKVPDVAQSFDWDDLIEESTDV